MRYAPVTKKKKRRAEAIEACFRPRERPGVEPVQRGPGAPEALRIVLRLPHSAEASLSVSTSAGPLLREPRLTRSPERVFEVKHAGVPAGDLRVRLEADGTAYTLHARVAWGRGSALVIDEWFPGVPPRVSLDGLELNRGLGVHLEQTAALPSQAEGTHNLFLLDRDATVLLDGEPVQLFVDDQPVAPSGFVVDRSLPVLHWATLPLGLHRVVVVVPRRRKVLVDTDVVINGFEEVRVSWTEPLLNWSEVVITKGLAEVFRGRMTDLPFRDWMAGLQRLPDRLVINGVEIPDGIDKYKEEIEAARETASAMVANYRGFIWRRVELSGKKRRGEPLTPEEEALLSIETSGQIDAWVAAKKRTEGRELEIVGQTGPDGEMTYVGHEPQDPFEELEKRITLQVHEPSHVEHNKGRATRLGLDWRKVFAYLKAQTKLSELVSGGKSAEEARAALSASETEAVEWGWRHFPEVSDYLELPLANEAASDEIGEYLKEIKFYTELLEALQEGGR